MSSNEPLGHLNLDPPGEPAIPACEVCHNLRPGTKEIKGTGKQLVASAKAGCVPCRILLRAIRDFGRSWDVWDEAINWATYRIWVPQEEPTPSLRIDINVLYEPDGNKLPELRSLLHEMLFAAEQHLELYVAGGKVTLESLPYQPSPWPGLQTSQHLFDFSTADKCSKIIKSWVNRCTSTHSRCSSESASKLPTRVVDVGSSDPMHHPFLYESLGEVVPYACLSHRWGKIRPLTTTKTTLQAMKMGISWERLPKTFRDAIELTRELNIKYIWIDSLCIVQDDLDDWEKEASAMEAIYGGSYLTITASANSDGERPLFPGNQTVDVTHIPNDEMSHLETVGKAYVRRTREAQFESHQHFQDLEYLDPAYPLRSRAWAFQEHLLPPRVVQFTIDEMIWECNQDIWCCCTDLPAPLHGRKAQLTDALNALSAGMENPDNTLHDNWARIVQAYTTKSMTEEKDKLTALSGIARKFQRYVSSEYLVGLWRATLVQGLCWHAVSGGHCWRPNQRRAPSWSWASLEGPVAWLSRAHKDETWITGDQDSWPMVPDIQIEHATFDHIKLTGRVVKASFAYDWWGNFFDDKPEFNFRIEPLGEWVGFQADVSSELGDGNNNRLLDTVYCLKAGTSEKRSESKPPIHRVLVLRRVEDVPDTYSRVGLLSASYSEIPRWFEGVELQEITLI